MTLSIAIVNYKTCQLTLKLLKSLYQENLPDIEVVVVDNGSEDRVGEEIKKHLPQVVFIQNQENTGFAKGYNRAVSKTTGEYILILNSDIEVKTGSLKKLLDAADSFNGQAVVAGKLILPDGSTQKSAFHLPTITGAIREYLLGQKDSFFSYLPDQQMASKVEGAVMACFMVPRKIWEKVGKLDEGTRLYFEDVDYCQRLKRAGVPIYYIPEAIFDHHHGASAKKLPEGESYKRLQEASRRYHGPLKYALITLILWLGQKLR